MKVENLDLSIGEIAIVIICILLCLGIRKRVYDMYNEKWTNTEDKFLFEEMDKHRYKSVLSLAEKIHKENNIIQNRSVGAIYQHFNWLKRQARFHEIRLAVHEKKKETLVKN
jgi:hypothetical protein